MRLATLLFGQVYRFRDINEVMAKANEEKSGDRLAGVAAESLTEMVAAKEVLGKVFVTPEKEITYVDPQVEKILRLFEGKAIGADIAGQTGWGLVNAVTEYADHHKRARSQGNRLDNAWFGTTANIKNAVFHEVLGLTL